MNEAEKIEFIAEKPKMIDDGILAPWPADTVFEALRNSEYSREEGADTKDGNNWQYENAMYNLRDEYFRMRYRGALWPYEKFFNEPLAEDPKQRLEQLLVTGMWAPAVDQASQLFADTEEDQYRQTAIFACGLHIADVLDHSWTFLNPRLAQDSTVREKHFLIFLSRIAGVGTLPMSPVEAAYFEPLRMQFNLAYAEMAAQSPYTASRDLLSFDPQAREAEEYHGVLSVARASNINFVEAPNEIKERVIERFKHAAWESFRPHAQYRLEADPYALMRCLHLFGLAAAPNFYAESTELQWWRLTPAEIMAGDVSRVHKLTSEAEETFTQDSLF